MVRSYRGRWPISRADQVRAYLAVCSADCPRCKYNLRGLRDPRCPECGLELDVQELSESRPWFLPRPGSLRPAAAWAAAVNILLAFAVIGSAIANHGMLPALAFLSPAVAGAFFFSLAYWPVFVRFSGNSIETPPPPIGTAWFAAAMQAAGLVLLWV